MMRNSNVYGWAAKYGISGDAFRELLTITDPAAQAPVYTDKHSSEAGVQAALRVSAAANGASLWRNNNGAMTDSTGRSVRFGLGNDSTKLSRTWKSSDLIGITPVMATAAGQVFGVFTAVEVKAPGWKKPSNARERAQQNFLNTVQAMGGLSMFAQSTADYERNFL